MGRDYVAFGNIEGKLDVLRVECTRCARKRPYAVAKLVAQYGRDGSMMQWREQLSADCPKHGSARLHDR